MHKVAESKLLSGFIYGDNFLKEYVYLPASELNTDNPLLVYETKDKREDISMQKALTLIEKRSLKEVNHPSLGKRTM